MWFIPSQQHSVHNTAIKRFGSINRKPATSTVLKRPSLFHFYWLIIRYDMSNMESISQNSCFALSLSQLYVFLAQGFSSSSTLMEILDQFELYLVHNQVKFCVQWEHLKALTAHAEKGYMILLTPPPPSNCTSTWYQKEILGFFIFVPGGCRSTRGFIFKFQSLVFFSKSDTFVSIAWVQL